MISVLLADEQKLVRAGLKLILSTEVGFAVVGECADGQAALQAAQALRPAVVVMDVRIAGMDGVELTQRLRALPRAPAVLILTSADDDTALSGALRGGATGFLLKHAPADDLVRATRIVAEGGAWLDPAVTGRVLSAYRAAPPTVALLSPRELAVMRLIGRGATNREIAARLAMDIASVKSDIGRIMEKLQLRDRAATAAFAFDYGLVARSA